MIRNPDGTPYQVSGDITQYNPEAPEHNLFNQWDQEAIQRGGSPIYYYEMFVQPQTVDPLYIEDRGKLFSKHPIQLWGVYDPALSQNFMNQFGVDGLAEMKIEFNYRAVLKAIGHPPKLGSRLYTPHLRENWIIIQRDPGEFKMWGALRLNLLVQHFQETDTTEDGKVTQKSPNVPGVKIV